MNRTARCTALAALLVVVAGAAAAMDQTYTSSEPGVDAGTAWAGRQSVIVRPDDQATANIAVDVVAGDGVVQTGRLLVVANNSITGYPARDVTLTFTETGTPIDITFTGEDLAPGDQVSTVAGTDDHAAAMSIVSNGNSATVTIDHAFALANNATLNLTGADASFIAAENMAMTITDPDVYGTAPKLNITQGATLEVTGVQGLVVQDGTVTVGQAAGPGVVAGGNLFTTAFTLGTADSAAANNRVVVQNGGNFIVQADSSDPTVPTATAIIRNGTFDVMADAGDVEFHGGVRVDGNLSVLNVSKDIFVGDALNGSQFGITLANGGTLNIGDGVAATTVNVSGDDSFIQSDANSFINVRANATLTAVRIASGGTTAIAGAVVANSFAVTGGTTGITGTVTADTFEVSGGTVNLTGGVTARAAGGTGAFNASGGRVNVETGADLAADSIAVSGNAVLDIMGNINADAEISVRGGTVSFRNSSTFDGGDSVAKLAISGNSTVNIDRAIQTAGGADSFSLAGGTVNIQSSGSLEVMDTGLSTPLSLSGTVNLAAADGLIFHNDATFRAGGIRSQIQTATVAMNGKALTIGSGATLDASSGNLVVADAGGLGITGSYRAGHDGNNVTMARVEVTSPGGSVEIGPGATISITTALERAVHTALAAGERLQILESDTALGAVDVDLNWTTADGIYTYYYQTALDGGGNLGLFVVDAIEMSDGEKYARLINNWNRVDQVNGYATRLISGQLSNAIFEARKLQVSSGYDQLNQSGKFNADALASLVNPYAAGAGGYDALMLYNGSGSALANQAILGQAGQILRRVGLRNSFLRREYAEVGDTLGCGSTLASAYLNQELGNRVWAGLVYADEDADWDQGFAGYSLRSKGVSVGYDRLFGGLSAGAAFSYLGGDYADKAALGSSSTLDTYAFDLYGNYIHPSGLFATGAVGMAYTDARIEDNRILLGKPGLNTADYRTDSFMAALSVGYDFQANDNLVISPSVGFSYLNARAGDHSQFFRADDGSASGGTLDISGVRNHSTQIPLELAASYDLIGTEQSLFSLNARLGYAFELNDKPASGMLSFPGLEDYIPPMAIAARPAPGNVFTAGFGGKYLYRQFEASLNYDYYHRNKQTLHALTGYVGMNF